VSVDPAEALVSRHLDELRVDHELVPCDPGLADTALFCAAYNIDPADSANTIVVVGKGAVPVHVACVVLATTRLDVNNVVRRRLGVKKASFASAAETRELTGMVLGGVTPFGLPDGWPVWIDAAVLDRPKIIVGGGSRSQKVRCVPSGLLRIAGAEVVDGLAHQVTP
jgi:prolyl-tRNA editing enzyme YbaK/EbsC (Cys-tRNA(Pro) deacylase)